MTEDATMIRFRCPQCNRAWKVEKQHAGKKFRCPACFKERTIPDANDSATDAALPYGMHQPLSDAQEIIKSQALISFKCRVCKTNLAVPFDQAGKISVCPDCNTENIVPEQSAETYAAERIISTNEAVEIYGFADEQNAESLKNHHKDLFPVRCPLCNTLLYASDEQIGTSLKCPDCFRDVPILSRPEKPKDETFQAKIYEGSSTYEFQSENRFSPNTRLVPVVCSICATRMYATVDEIGQKKECPDCGTMNLVTAVREEEIKTAEEIFPSAGAYDVTEAAPNPKMRVNVDYRTVEDAVIVRRPRLTDDAIIDFNSIDAAEIGERIRENKEKQKKKKRKRKKNDDDFDEDDDTLTKAEKIESRARKRSKGKTVADLMRPKLPKRPLTQGFWNLFANTSFYLRMVLVMVIALIPAGLFAALFFDYAPGITELAGGGAGSVIVYLFFFIFFGLFVCFGGPFFAQMCLAVSSATSNGADEVEDWGGISLLPAIQSLIILMLSFLAGWTPVIIWNAILTIIQSEHAAPDFMFPVCAGLTFFLFPITLLRILEGFEQNIFKSSVLWSLWLTPMTWLRFYLLSGVICLFPAMLIAALFFVAESVNMIGAACYSLAFCLPFFSLCYFRLFGRLGWVIEETIRQKHAEMEEEAIEEMELLEDAEGSTEMESLPTEQQS